MTPPELLLMARIHVNMDVCDSERVKIGTVEKTYLPVDYGNPPPRIAPTLVEPYLKVAHADRDLFIPAGAVSDVTSDGVVLNVLRDRIAEQGWDQRPDFIQG